MTDEMYYKVIEVAKILHTREMNVRIGIRERAVGWDFPAIVTGQRIMIPRHSFDVWYRERFGKDVNDESKTR